MREWRDHKWEREMRKKVELWAGAGGKGVRGREQTRWHQQSAALLKWKAINLFTHASRAKQISRNPGVTPFLIYGCPNYRHSAAHRRVCVYGNEVHVRVKYGMVTLHHMPTAGIFFTRATLFNWKSCCAREASCMEMRATVNGWTQEGMNGVQEAVHSEWRKWHLAERTAMCLVVERVFSECQWLRQLNLHFNNYQVSVNNSGVIFIAEEMRCQVIMS